MITINLLPVRQIKQRIRSRNEFILLIAGLLLLLITLSFVGYGQSVKISTLEAKKTALQAEKKKYDAVIARINKLKKERDLLEVKLATIEKLQANSQLSVRVLAEIAGLTPSSRMWLQTLKMDKKAVSLKGIALDNATIAQYMERIKASPFFSGAVLSGSAMTQIANQKLKSFSLLLRQNHP